MATIIYWQDPDTGATESVQLDAVDSVVPDDQLTITDHTVEGGAVISDHAQKDPNSVTIEGIVSNMPNPKIDTDAHQASLDLRVAQMNTPGTKTITLNVPRPPVQLSPSGLIQAGVVAVVDLLSGAGSPKATVHARAQPTTIEQSVQVFQQDAPRDRVRDVYEQLLKVQEAKLLCTIQTRRREYFDMLLKGIGEPDTIEDGKAGRFQLEFRYLKVADSQTVQAPQPTEARGNTAVSKGSQAAKTDPNADKKGPLRSTKKEERLAGR